MKLRAIFALALLIAATLGITGCDSGPKISGRSASRWIADLEDLNPQTKYRAIDELASRADDATYREVEAVMEEKARNGNFSAALSQFKRRGKVYPECADLYVSYIGSEECEDALMRLGRENYVVAYSAVERAKAEAKEDWNKARFDELLASLKKQNRP